jgi:hypothetical protein
MTDEWVSYLQADKGWTPVTSIPLFPAIDGPLDAAAVTKMEQDRFSWLVALYGDSPHTLFTLWTDETFMMDERKALGNISLDKFYVHSVGLGLHLLRREVRQLAYIRALRNALRSRLDPGIPVFFFGPTSGAEIEAIHNAGGRPILVSQDEGSKWQHLCEARLLDSRVPFDTVAASRLRRSRYSAHFAVLSGTMADPKRTVPLALAALGKFGFLVTPRTNLSLGHQVQKLSLKQVDTHQTSVGVWFKPPD